ncbi:C4-dicarboxylate transporter DctM subunit [Caldalkalibacillus uzonensis]|uniref:C4-dicarboxylate transporter DctM subunit n=1 Tax=Caldalkalibacillus uzonensis TaxID=353224 RepID=A0ABU0CNA9_9BACI|nr:TRAP transporter large permease [Caldalkalibacillus uzonensis]MDQ0337366.1 C4-dicarboxylate transporter DctM subunit [Caldalkalibacillus uzonensis]
MITLLFISLLILMALSVPISISLGLATTITVWFGDLTSLKIIVQQMFNSINSFPLMAIPFFILAGYLMESGGISQRLVNFATALVGHITGGLAMVAIVTSLFFAAISGSGAATTAAIGAILIPAMIARGYSPQFATANQAVSGALGVIIPPSIPLILYGIAAQQSIGDMFLAGIIPGILVGCSLIITAYFISKKRGYIGVEKRSFKDLIHAFRKAVLSLFMPFLVLGGIYGGVFTPTEAAVIAVAYSFIVGFVIYREIKLKDIFDILKRAAVTTSVVMSIIATAGLFSFILNRLGVPSLISDAFLSTTTSVVAFIFLVNILLLITGMFIEAAAAILIFVPILLPLAVNLGLDPVHFGIIMVVNLAMGMFTPPVGINLFVASQISGIKLERLTKAIIPFVIVLFVNLIILSFVPFLSTWLPSLGD